MNTFGAVPKPSQTTRSGATAILGTALTATLDALTRDELCAELQRTHREHPSTVVLVTHSVDEAVMPADRVVVLTPRPGRIRTVLDITLPRPRTRARAEQAEQLARRAAELHALLLDSDT